MLRCFTLILLLFATSAYSAAPRTFSEAKKAAWKLYAGNPVEFYCGCRYNGNKVDLKSCGYVPRKNAQRAARIEWEHVVPAWVIGHQRQCWQKGGRSNCSKTDSTYRIAEADLHNLVPSIGEVNGDRSNYGFGWLPQKPTQYGACPMVVDLKARKAMPRQQVRGMIARTYFYMAERYALRLSKQDRQLYGAWDKAYPARKWGTGQKSTTGLRDGTRQPFRWARRPQCVPIARSVMCGGVEAREAEKAFKVYFPSPKAAFPVVLVDGGELGWVRWGKREGETGIGPRGGWAKLETIERGGWDKYRPRPALGLVDRFMEKDGQRTSHWFDVPDGYALRCLVTGEGDDQRVFVVTSSPPEEYAWVHDRWPQLALL